MSYVTGVLNSPMGSGGGGSGAGYGGTSATSLTIGTGSQTFVVEAGLAWQVGNVVRLQSGVSWMEGPITAYTGTSMTVNVTATSGSGTLAAWVLGPPGGPQGVAGTAGSPGPGAQPPWPSGGVGLWVMADYQSTYKLVPNRLATGSIPALLTRFFRGGFASAAFGNAGGDIAGWLLTSATVTEKYAAGRDGQMLATRFLSSGAGQGTLRYRSTPTLPAGTYCMVMDVKSNTGVNQSFDMSRDNLATTVSRTATPTMTQVIYEFTLATPTTWNSYFIRTPAGVTLDLTIDKAFLWAGNAASVPADLVLSRSDCYIGNNAYDAFACAGGELDLSGGACGHIDFPAILTGTELTLLALVKRTGAYNHIAGYRQAFLYDGLQSTIGSGNASLGEFEAEGYLRFRGGGLNASTPALLKRDFQADGEYWVVGGSCDRRGADVFIDDWVASQVVGVPTAPNISYLRCNSGHTALAGKHKVAALAVFNRRLTADERRQAVRYLREAGAASALTVRRPKNGLVALGDSITAGTVNGSYAHKYMGVAGKPIYMNVEAIGGSTIMDNATASLNLSTRLHWALESVPRREEDRTDRRRIATILIGANDLQPYYNDATAFLRDLAGIAQMLRSQGIIVAVGTILAKGSSQPGFATHNTLRATVNARIRRWPGVYCDFVVDFAADANIGTDAAPNSTTYFSDGLHPNDAGHDVMRDIYKTAVDPWLL